LFALLCIVYVLSFLVLFLSDCWRLWIIWTNTHWAVSLTLLLKPRNDCKFRSCTKWTVVAGRPALGMNERLFLFLFFPS
jgi:hypothetical protein